MPPDRRTPTRSWLRGLGWVLLIVGGVVTARAVWLAAMYWRSMSEVSQQRTWMAIGLGIGATGLGLWLTRRCRAA
jgi:hypothetical protein